MTGVFNSVEMINDHYRQEERYDPMLFVDHTINGGSVLCAVCPTLVVPQTINQVEKDEQGRWHLTRHATFSLSQEQVGELLDSGELLAEDSVGTEHLFTLINEPDEASYEKQYRIPVAPAAQ